MKQFQKGTESITVGVVGLGLMGTSIVASLLLSGHPVVALAPIDSDLDGAEERIAAQLNHSNKTGLLKAPVSSYLEQLVITSQYSALHDCEIVMECVIELLDIKKSVYHKIAAVVSVETIISTNTSALPITLLQELVSDPERFLGIHWAEPAYMTRFLEITCGEKTDLQIAERMCILAKSWGKDPTLLRKDIRGFITNRLMYAMYREALSLVEGGAASLEDVDKALRYDAGSWMTMMGIFQRMDYLGLPNQLAILQNLTPQLNNSSAVPQVMRDIVAVQGRGVQDGKGFFSYSKEEGRKWEEAFAAFNEDIYHLAEKYRTKNTEPAC